MPLKSLLPIFKIRQIDLSLESTQMVYQLVEYRYSFMVYTAISK